MRDLKDCSGPWAGLWIQGRIRGQMTLRMEIAGLSLHARGSDLSGPFAMRGTYDPETDDVRIDKMYPWVLVEYRGKWDGSFISGTWKIEPAIPFHTGAFEMWPLDEELSLDGLSEPMALPEPTQIRGTVKSPLP